MRPWNSRLPAASTLTASPDRYRTGSVPSLANGLAMNFSAVSSGR